MKPSERLKEIEEEFHRHYSDYSDKTIDGIAHDLVWLISRVKKLTEALTYYAEGDHIGVPDCGVPTEDGQFARDALVAEKVMGWKGIVQPHPEMPAISLKDLYEDSSVPMPKYSTSIEAAWQVVEKLEGNIDISCDHGDPVKWQVHWTIINNGSPISAQANWPTLPLAICLAALKLKGIDVSEWEKNGL